MVLFRKRSPTLFWRLGLSALIALQGVFMLYIAGYYLFAAPDAVIIYCAADTHHLQVIGRSRALLSLADFA